MSEPNAKLPAEWISEEEALQLFRQRMASPDMTLRLELVKLDLPRGLFRRKFLVRSDDGVLRIETRFEAIGPPRPGPKNVQKPASNPSRHQIKTRQNES